MERNTRVEVAEGLHVSFGSDGHWLDVDGENGRKASLNIENASMPAIARSAFISWADSWLDKACERCKGHGVIDAPTSADDPSCPDCDGEGLRLPSPTSEQR